MSIRSAIKADFYSLGLHAGSKQVVAALKAKGIHVITDFVKRLTIELFKATNVRAIDECLGNRAADRGQKIPAKRPGRQ